MHSQMHMHYPNYLHDQRESILAKMRFLRSKKVSLEKTPKQFKPHTQTHTHTLFNSLKFGNDFKW